MPRAVDRVRLRRRRRVGAGVAWAGNRMPTGGREPWRPLLADDPRIMASPNEPCGNESSERPSPAPDEFPPAGWVTNHEAARMLGVGLNTLTCVGWKWRAMLRGHGKWVRRPGGGRSNIYPLACVEEI